MSEAVDLIMWVGEEYYTVSSFIEEAKAMGVSKRIPSTAIPEGIVSGESRLFFKHKKAILRSPQWEGLLEELKNGGMDHALAYRLHEVLPQIEDLSPNSLLPADMVSLVTHFERKSSSDQAALIERFQITFHPGVFGYVYLTGVEYEVKPGETGLPEQVSHMEGYITPVHTEYEAEAK